MSESTRRTHPVQYAIPYAATALKALGPYIDQGEIAGSIRRGRSHVKDIEIVVQPSEVSDGLFGDVRPAVPEVRAIAEGLGPILQGGDRFIQVANVLGSGITLDLFLVHPPADWGVILAIRTGPRELSTAAVSAIRGRLWKCEHGWIRDDRGKRVPCPTEEEFFEAARMPCLDPHDRDEWRVLA